MKKKLINNWKKYVKMMTLMNGCKAFGIYYVIFRISFSIVLREERRLSKWNSDFTKSVNCRSETYSNVIHALLLPQVRYFKAKNFRGQKVLRIQNVAKSSDFKFREL